MDGEDSGHQGTGPERRGHLPQGEEQEDGGGRMEQHAAQVMAPGGLLIDLPVEHVRQPGERMPVGGVEMAEGPDHVLPAQAAGDVRVAIDILVVVKVHEAVPDGPAEDRQDGHQEEATDQQDRFGRFHRVSLLLLSYAQVGQRSRKPAPQAVRASAGKPWGLPLPAAVRGERLGRRDSERGRMSLNKVISQLPKRWESEGKFFADSPGFDYNDSCNCCFSPRLGRGGKIGTLFGRPVSSTLP